MSTRKEMYDEIHRVLTDYENNEANEQDLYEVLANIQEGWKDIVKDSKYTENEEIRVQLARYKDTGLTPEQIRKLIQQKDIYKENWIKLLDAMLAEFDKDGKCRLVVKKENVLQMKKDMENDYGIFDK